MVHSGVPAAPGDAERFVTIIQALDARNAEIPPLRALEVLYEAAVLPAFLDLLSPELELLLDDGIANPAIWGSEACTLLAMAASARIKATVRVG